MLVDKICHCCARLLLAGAAVFCVTAAAQQKPAAAPAAAAEQPVAGVLYKCGPTSDGRGTLITDDPNDIRGRDCVKIPPQRVNTVPFPRPAAKPEAKAPSRVDSAAQRSRDNDRRRILEEELASEQKRLAELKAEFNNGEPERRGDERNYQRYLDRVEKLKADISRSEANVESLRRELGAARN